MVDELQPLANDANIDMTILMKMNMETTIYADHHWMSRAILNVLSNAIEHTKSRIVIEISCEPNDTISIAVNDDGLGLKDIDKGSIFKPFSKGDESRNRDQQHYGLGLAIVSKVMEWHEGRVYADASTSLQGACFTMNLPVH